MFAKRSIHCERHRTIPRGFDASSLGVVPQGASPNLAWDNPSRDAEVGLPMELTDWLLITFPGATRVDLVSATHTLLSIWAKFEDPDIGLRYLADNARVSHGRSADVRRDHLRNRGGSP